MELTDNLPAHMVNGGTTVSGGRKESSAMAEHSLITLRLPITTFFPEIIKLMLVFMQLREVGLCK